MLEGGLLVQVAYDSINSKMFEVGVGERIYHFYSLQRLLLCLAVEALVHLVPELERALLHRVETQHQTHQVFLQHLPHPLL